MIKKYFSGIVLSTFFALATGSLLYAGDPAAPYENSSIDARLNVTVEPGTDVVHFVRDNADPNVITKTYILKHADPYELRGYLRKIVQTRKVDSSPTNVKAVKFSDGTAVLMISAEDYRFEDSAIGQGFDSIVAELDRKGLTASSGRLTYVYSPEFGSAEKLSAMVRAIGANAVIADGEPGYEMDNLTATDALSYDPELNLMFFKTAPFSKATIEKVLKEYDTPTPEVRAKVTVYEIYAEDDDSIGLDFQAWKNNDGVDLFNGGGRFMRNFNAAGENLVKGGGWSDTRYFQFNPKWNTRYIDFLTSRGKARVLNTSEMVLSNGETSTMSVKTKVFYAKASDAYENTAFLEKGVRIDVEADTLVGTDFSGNAIVTADAGEITVLELGKSENAPRQYTLRMAYGKNFTVDGRRIGSKAVAATLNEEFLAELIDNSIDTPRGKKVETEGSSDFGYTIAMTPSVAGKATTLNIVIDNSSLIGYKANGEPRIQEGASVAADFMISNQGTKLVIGGVEKRNVVRVSGGLPFFKDLPLLGWLFSTERESSKKSQLVVVAEVLPVKEGETYTAAEKAEMDEINEKLKNAGESNSFGYRQYGLDADR